MAVFNMKMFRVHKNYFYINTINITKINNINDRTKKRRIRRNTIKPYINILINNIFNFL